jgi:hypothetical protein
VCRAKIFLSRRNVPPRKIAVAASFSKLCFSAPNGFHGACVQGKYALDDSTELTGWLPLRCERPRTPNFLSGFLVPPACGIDVSADLFERALPFAVMLRVLADGAASLNESVFDLHEPLRRVGKVDAVLPSDHHVRVRYP